MIEIKLIDPDQISKETLTNYAREYIRNQRSYFKNIHICKSFVHNELNLSYQSHAYKKIYLKLIYRFAYIIAHTLKIEFNLKSLGKGLYLKEILNPFSKDSII